MRTPLHTWSVVTATAVSALLFAPNAATQSSKSTLPVPDGFLAKLVHNETNGPFALSGFSRDPNTDHHYLAVNEQLIKVDNQSRRTVLVQLPTGEGFGLTTLPAGGLEVFAVNWKTHELFRYHVVTGKLAKMAGIPNTYDVALDASGGVLVVANPNFPNQGAQSGIWLMDMSNNGKHKELIRLQGPSGPIALDSKGDLYYAVQSSTFPTPKGAVSIVRFTAAQLQAARTSTTPLPMSQGTTVIQNLDGGYDLVFDDRERLYISDPQNGGLLRTRPGSTTLDSTFLPRITKPTTLATLGMQFVNRSRATLDAYQPGDGGELYLVVNDWSSISQVHVIQALRPTLASTPAVTIPKGPIQVDVTEAPRNANLLLFLSPLPPLAAETIQFVHRGMPGWVGLDLTRPFLVLPGQTDATGSYGLRSQNPGGNAFQMNVQALIVEPTAGPNQAVATTGVLRLNVQK